MKERDIKSESAWGHAIAVFSKFSAWVIAPVVVGITAGYWLDNKYNGNNVIFLISVTVTFVLSTIGLIRTALSEIKRFDKNIKNLKNIQKIKNKDYTEFK